MTELVNPAPKAISPASEKDCVAQASSVSKLFTLPSAVSSESFVGAFEKVTRLACRLFNAPLSLVNLAHDGTIWHQSYCDTARQSDSKAAPWLELPACVHSMILNSAEASLNMQQFSEPLEVNSHTLRFYASVALVTNEGFFVGNLCIFDKNTRLLDESEVATLKDLAAIAMDEIELRLAGSLIVKDGQKHEEIQKALRESEERYSALINLLSDWQWEQDANGRFTSIETTTRLQGKDLHHSYVGKTFRELPGLAMAERDWHVIDKVLSAREPFQEVTLKWNDEDGRTCYMAVSGQPIFSPDGCFKGYRGVGKDITEKVQAHQEMVQTNAALLEMSVGYQAFREAERKKIARELHDELAQLLATSRMELCLLQQDLTPEIESRNRLDSLDQMIGSSIVSLRRIATDLRPSSLDEGGLYYALRTLLKNFSETEKIDCQLIANEEDLHLDEARSTAIFRLVQESLSNVRQHANASKAVIQIYRNGKRLELRIQDNGRGIRMEEMSKEKAYGLLDMRSRVAEMNGKIEIKGQPNKGTRIAVSLPLFK